jgi:nucleoside-diphosphate-sugar epimerase
VASALEATWRTVRSNSQPPLTRFELAFAAMPRRYDIGRIRRELGYTPRVTRAEGFARLTAHPARPERRS